MQRADPEQFRSIRSKKDESYPSTINSAATQTEQEQRPPHGLPACRNPVTCMAMRQMKNQEMSAGWDWYNSRCGAIKKILKSE